MKKLSTILLAIVLLLALTTTALAANADRSETLTYRHITVRVNGQVLVPADANGKAVEPFIMQGSTYLPLRSVAGALGLSAHWNAKTCTVELTSGADPDFGWGTPLGSKATKKATLAYRNIKVVLDGQTLSLKDVNGKAVEPFIINGVSYLPLRAIAEALGVEVHWNGSTNEVLMTKASHRRADNDKKDEGLMISLFDLFGGEEEEEEDDIDYSTIPLCFTAQEASTVKLTETGEPDTIDLQYSNNNKTWKKYTIGDPIKLAKGEKVYFQAPTTNSNFSDECNYYHFTLTGKLSVSGNLMSLVDTDYTTKGAAYTLLPYMFYCLFDQTSEPEDNQKALTDAKNLVLPATTLAEGCYSCMFEYCTALKTAPKELPATDLSGAKYCYDSMFMYCDSLETAPQELPATTLAEYCYCCMFQCCTSLETAPDLPATTLVEGCYAGMFNNCTNLSSINVSFTEWDATPTTIPIHTNATDNWVNGVSSTGTFTCPPELPQAKPANVGTSAIPTGWTVRNPN